MQIKGFIFGLAVASLAWAGLPAVADLAAARAAPTVQEAPAPRAHYHAMGGEQHGSHAELMRRWEAMTPEQREAHRQLMRCPYAGRAGGSAGVQAAREPLEI
jgi:hypothetical protein